MKKNIALVFVLSVFATTAMPQAVNQKIIAGRVNSKKQEQKPYVILISADGFRWDYAEKFNAVNLLKFARSGVTAQSMIPSFPSLTFPNHYTLVTGLYPAHHGLVGNAMFDAKKNESYSLSNRKAVQDSSWYGGTPLWVLAERQQMLSACFYWVGSEAAVQGTRPTYYYDYSDAIKMDDRIAAVKKWLELPEAQRPHLITFYFPEVDHEAHKYGPDAKETQDAVHLVDESIGRMVAVIDSLHLPVNYIFVSDHGMTEIDTTKGIALPAVVDTAEFIIPRGDALVQLYAKNKTEIQPTYERLKATAKDYDVYLATNMPAKWHYSKSDDRFNRIGDIILIPHLPFAFRFGNQPVSPGKHGYDPEIKDMHATFMAWGPQLKKRKRIGAFENVNVYPLISKILGLTYTDQIDGNINILKKITR
ncbi:MAG TPA: ectonucleotide pyrophosphatase/phosphodiesterase [Panacibacter sp.]|nr:ectonucleotide pyrophosphatase/phosphodiesterase [Panacibacter sp.]HNP45723.1 ectonucleotide pyrophosphatase/phosphodiesterase [Panacibacter sp.]